MIYRIAETRFAGKPLAGVFADHFFIRGDLDTTDLVVGDETFQPLQLGTKLLEKPAELCEML